MSRRLALVLSLFCLVAAGLGAWGYFVERDRSANLSGELQKTRARINVLHRLADSQGGSLAHARTTARQLHERIDRLENPSLARIPMVLRYENPWAPAVSSLAPSDASIEEFHLIPGDENIPREIAVLWDRGDTGGAPKQSVLSVWQPHPDNGTTLFGASLARWKTAFWINLRPFTPGRLKIGPPGHAATRKPFGAFLDLDIGDLTGDGHPELLVNEVSTGSGGCGIYRIFTNLGSEMAQIFRSEHCEHPIVIHHGELWVDSATYPKGCDSIHGCGIKRTILRWNGSAWSVEGRTLLKI